MKRITATQKVPLSTSPYLTYVSFWHPPFLSVSRRQTCTYHLILLYTQSSSRTLAPPVLPQLLARDWLELLFRVPSYVVLGERGLQSIDLHPSRNLTGSGFRPLSKIPYCWLRWARTVFQFRRGHSPLRMTKDLRFGKLLSHQHI